VSIVLLLIIHFNYTVMNFSVDAFPLRCYYYLISCYTYDLARMHGARILCDSRSFFPTNGIEARTRRMSSVRSSRYCY